ncbi:TonB-dependent receptor [Flavobacteriaceae bacterium XHP0103]|uniref:TonB-dependent receptor n=1 Tax=Marixanthotalea marina TaxID=2844359 RepID=UPI002989C20E|nr:TonB-dependent receptor [Marixanthotalea marina]MBU3820960.1 TonB-dependent receptor [Marixanthotalea marina]
MKKITKLLFLVMGLLFSNFLIAQNSLSGEIKDSNGNGIEGTSIVLKPSNKYGITNNNGYFEIHEISSGSYSVTISHLGYKPLNDTIDISSENTKITYTLEDDLLSLGTIVVTGTFDPREKLQSSTSVSTLSSKKLNEIAPRGTANILQNVPGTFTDATAGEVFTKVYTRGISAAAEDDLGWYYVSLQEDGLPVSLAQHSYYSPDLFFRYDITTERLEAIRGGSSSITAMNAPGGIYNFISRGIRPQFGGDIQLQSGIQGNGNVLYRVDASIGGPLGNNWFLNVGGHYRHDDGARNTSFPFSKGGQIKFNLTKEYNSGYLKFYGKVLNDKTNRWNGVAATNWNNPTPAFGQNFRNTSLLMPEFHANIPDGRNLDGNATNAFDPSQGVHAQDYVFGVDFSQDLGNNWSIRNNMKFSSKDANWQTSISNVFVSLNDPLAYFITGADFPIGQVVFRDTRSGSEVARIDNSPILGGGSFQYLNNGRLPNDAIMGTSAWYKENEADEFMQQLTFRKEWTNHDLNFGFSSGLSNTSLFTQGSFAFVTYEPSPRMLQVTLENPGDPTVALSDTNGVSNYGGLFYVNAEAKISQFAGFANDLWKLSDKVHLDLGLRLESIKHNGSKDRFAPFSQTGGLDGDPNTAYDNGILASTGDQDKFNYNYTYLSYSAGINFEIANNAALFARLSKGNKAPELNYYFNNFSNVPINGKGEVQKINQIELGIKSNLKNFSFTSTLFWSQLKNIGISNFEFDPNTNDIFYTPIQFNTSETIGLEWESVYSPLQNLRFLFNGVLQDTKAKTWTIYDAAGSVDTADDSVQDYSGNKLPFNPAIMFNLSAEYQFKKFSSFLKWQFMGEREGNVANAFQLPSYSIFDLGLGYAINKNLSANVLVTNLLNSEGLANFFGANNFGANANGATQEFIQANPDASFVVVPVLPRGTILKLTYSF